MSGAARPEESRLSRMIERLATQRACLDRAAGLIARVPGPVIELGLGKGRTYDHLRLILPEREIFAFDFNIHAPPDCVPDETHLVFGDFLETLESEAARLGAPAALAHADIGSENLDEDAERAAAIVPLLEPLMAPGAIVLGDREMPSRRWTAIELPADAGTFDYYMYRVEDG